MTAPPASSTEFDQFADDYEGALQQGLSVSGESSEFFARARIAFLSAQLRRLGWSTDSVLDYGCGTGTSAPLLRDALGASTIVGVDVSDRSLARARAMMPWACFSRGEAVAAGATFDVAYCNGVFHHIPPVERPGALAYVRDRLRPGGYFSFWENNPWNPGTRLVMRRIPFDRDAITIPATEARHLLGAAGFEVVSVDFLFIFPRALRALRPLEQRLSRLPLGAQYQVLARRPAAS